MTGQFYFGTEGRMRWMRAPSIGMDSGAVGRGTDGTTANGLGYVNQSVGTHRQYLMEWPPSSSLPEAAVMEGYRNRVYGRGPLYFHSPLTLPYNVLSARHAAPAMACGLEGTSFIDQYTPTAVATSGAGTNDLPAESAYYDLLNAAVGFQLADSVFIPVPPGYTAYVGSFYQATGTGVVAVVPVDLSGADGASVTLTALANNATNIVPDVFYSVSGLRLWLGKTSSGAASVLNAANIIRMYPDGEAPDTAGPWLPGMGHSGCRFVGEPTHITNGGMYGGMVSYAATLKEVGR
mgnify:CR=1 FL=1